MKTIQQAAESAAEELNAKYSREWWDQLSPGSQARLEPEYEGACLERKRISQLIARHYSDYAALRDAAERAEKWISADLARRREIVKIYVAEEESALYFIEVENELTALRGLLNTQPTKETLKL